MQDITKGKLPQVLEAAYLSSLGNSQTEIAKLMGTTQPAVSRLLAEAVNKEILKDKPTLNREFVSDAQFAELERKFDQNNELVGALRKLLPTAIEFELRVCSAPTIEFHTEAAKRILELLPRARLLGLLWGRTVANLVNALSDIGDIQKRLPNAREIQCIPLCGEPLFLMNQGHEEFSASQLAARLDRALGGHHELLPSLTGVPAYLGPRGTNQEARRRHKILVEFYQSVPGYRDIFQKKGALVERVDTVITGVGVVKSPEPSSQEIGAFLRERVEQKTSTFDELHKLSYGGIGGLMIKRTNLTKAMERRFKKLNSGWLGIQAAHIERIVKSAGNEGVGVILVARQAHKKELVLELLHLGFINQLIIDETLATELAKELGCK